MSRVQVLLATGGFCLLVLGLGRQWSTVIGEHRTLLTRSRPLGAAVSGTQLRRRLDRRLRHTRLGRGLGERLDAAALPITILEAAGLSALGTLLAAVAAAYLLNRTAGIVVVVASPLVARAVLHSFTRRRAARMVDQIPELAAALAGGAAAGLSLPVALRLAAQDLADPLASELSRALESLAVGTGTQSALREIGRRLPSRELDLLIVTLAVQARGGGNLVKALRRLTESLERRRETQREYRSLTAGSTSTAYLMIFFGVAITAMLQRSFPGSLDRTMNHPIGLAAVVVSLVLYVVGLSLVRRVARRPA